MKAECFERVQQRRSDRKRGNFFNIMYSLGSLSVELKTARRRLLYIFEVPDATLRSGLRTQPIPDAPHSMDLLKRVKTPSDLPLFRKWGERCDRWNV